MTAQEQQMIQGLVDRINQTQLSEKDPEAEQFLQQNLGRNPDALYILAQTVLVQQYALDQAQKQLADARSELEQLRQQQQQPKHTTSFLGSLLGRDDEPAPPPPRPQYAQAPYTPVPNYAPAPSYAPPPAYAPGYGAPQSGGFLRSAMQTAAGVAAGALAFQGIESLMHGFGGSGGYGSGFGGFGESNRPEVINNYYGDTPGHEHTDNLSPDIEDRRGESRFSQAVDGNDHGDSQDSLMGSDNSDDSANDFADDSSSFDDSGDGGDFDSGGGSDDSGF